MQSTSTTYNNILATANHYFEVKLNIAGDDYEQDVIFAAKSDSKLFDNEPTIGGTYSGTLEFSLLGDGADIPKMAAVKPYFRAVSGGSTSAWYQKGLYYIDTRSVTHNDSGITIFTAHCFDAMLKANAPYANSSLSWPAVDTAVVGEIATMMGITTDSRNTAIMNKSYSIPLPTSYTMRDVLSYIGAMYGANWCISDEGKLRIVPIGGSADTLAVGKSCSNLNLSPVRPVYTQVVYEVDDETAIVSGSTDTHVMEAYCPIGSQTAADRVLTTLSAWQYRPFDAVGCWSNPAVEVGDQITVNGESGTIYSRVISFGNGMVMDLSAPNDNYIDHEYTYESPEERRYTRTISGMSTEISNNAEAITLRATKTEAQGYASDAEAAAKSYADSQISISASGILSTVSQTYQTQANAAQMQSEIDQNAQNIALKVSTSDYNGQTIIGKINLDSSSATIAASHINLQGAVSISSLDSALQSEVSGIPAVNLLPSVYRREATNGSTWTYNGITWVVNADGSVTASGTATGISDYNLSYADASSPVPWIPIDTTKKHTISGAPNTAGCYIRVTLYSAGGVGQATYETTTSTVIPAGQYYRYAYVYLRITSGTAIPNGVTFYPMLEVGDVAHAYVSTHSGSGAIMAAAIASTVSCYYRSTTSTTPTISTSTSIGTAADTSNAWEYVMPYPKKNAYFFTCEKYTHADGSVSFSTVRSLSNADYTSKWCSSSDSTYIDGGNIYTGTVNANAIKANETFTQTLYAQDFRITGGSVNITTSSSTNDAIVLTYSIASATRTINLNAYTGVSVGYTDSSYSNVAELSHNGLSLKYNSGTYSDYYSNLTTDNIIIGNKSDRRLYATYNAIKFEKDPSNTGTVNGSITLQSYTSGGTLTFGTGDGGTLAINAYTGNMGMSMAYGSGESCTMSPSGGLVFKNSSNAVTATYGASDSSITGQYKSAKSPGAVSIAPSVAAFLSQTGANQTNIFMAHNTSTNNGIALGVGSGGVNRGILDYKAGADNGWLIYFNGTNIYLNKPTSAVSTFRIVNSNQYPSIVFMSADGKSGAYSQIFSDGASVNGIYETRNISFRNYSYNASTGAISSYYEQFSLPTVTTGLTAVKYYNILTTKVTGALTESDPTTTTALANNTYKSCGSVSLAAGTWLVMVEAQFSANATGTRYLIPSYTADSSSTAVHWSAEAIMPAVTASGYATAVKSTFVAHPTATSTVYFNCWQNSGSSLNVKIRYQIMRII